MNLDIKDNDFNELVEIFEKDGGEKAKYWISFKRLFIQTSYNEFMLRINEYSKELVIARIEIFNKRKGTGTKILNFLKDYGKNNNFKKIIVESVLTEEMHNFAQKNNFVPQKNIVGNYELNI